MDNISDNISILSQSLFAEENETYGEYMEKKSRKGKASKAKSISDDRSLLKEQKEQADKKEQADFDDCRQQLLSHQPFGWIMIGCSTRRVTAFDGHGVLLDGGISHDYSNGTATTGSPYFMRYVLLPCCDARFLDGTPFRVGTSKASRSEDVGPTDK